MYRHTEMGGGIVVGGGAKLKLESPHACCAACLAHNTAVPRPRGRRNCTTWVFNMDGEHAQFRECWFKQHDEPWADIELLAGGARSWTTGIALEPPPSTMGIVPTSRSCGDDRWRLHHPNGTAKAAPEALYPRPEMRGVHRAELSLCGAVRADEASIALEIQGALVRIRLNRVTCPKATQWLDALVDGGLCANRTRCAPHCCNFYRAEAAVGVHRLPDAFLRAHRYDPARPPSWGKDYWWGPPYAFIQGRLWHGGPGPWKNSDTNLPSEGRMPVLHRGTVELVGGGPDFLIALADHPMMPPHNAFGHVVEEDMHILDGLIEAGPIKVQNWGAINATVFEKAVPFFLRRLR